MTFDHPQPAKSRVLPAALLFSLLLGTACSAAQTIAGYKGRTTPAKPSTDEGGKPTDNGEGLPGYLVDPEKILVKFDRPSQTVVLTAPAGSVATDGGDVTNVVVSIWQVATKDLAVPAPGGEAPLAVGGRLLQAAMPGADGSFSTEVHYDSANPLVIATSGRTANNVFDVSETAAGKPTVALKDLLSSETFSAFKKSDLPLFKDLPTLPAETGTLDLIATDGPAAIGAPVAVSAPGTMFLLGQTPDAVSGGLGGAIYDAKNDAWEPFNYGGTPAGVTLRDRAAIAAQGSQLFIWGGYELNNGNAQVSTGAIYDLASKTWKSTSAIGPEPRGDAAVAWINDRIFIWGGTAGTVPLYTGELYDPKSDAWTTVTAAPLAHTKISSQALWTGTDVALVVRETDPTVTAANYGYFYAPGPGTWAAISLSGLAAAHFTAANSVAVSDGGKLYNFSPDAAAGHYYLANYNRKTRSWAEKTLDLPANDRWAVDLATVTRIDRRIVFAVVANTGTGKTPAAIVAADLATGEISVACILPSRFTAKSSLFLAAAAHDHTYVLWGRGDNDQTFGAACTIAP